MPDQFFLAVDGGGTKTQVLCANAAGEVQGEGVAGPTNLTATNFGAASFNLREGIRQATESLPEDADLSVMVMGLAGMDTPSEEVMARKIFSEAIADYHIEQFVLVNDTIIGLEGDSNNPNAVVLIAGTGSSCVGRNAEGKTAKAGGYDYLLTDQGSGYWIGREVLRAAMASWDHTGPKSLLEDLVCQQYQIKSILDLKDHVYNPDLGKGEVAESSRLCSEAFEQGDEVARQIFNQAVDELFTMVQAVMTRLHLVDKPTDIVLVGSITKIPYVNEKLDAKLNEQFPQLTIKDPEKPPVYGALKMALRETVQPE